MTRTELEHLTGWCLEVHDLAIAKTVAGRAKDLDFLRQVLGHRLVDEATLHARLGDTDLDDARRTLAEGRIARAAGAAPA